MKKFLIFLGVCTTVAGQAQDIIVKADKNAPWRKEYRAEATKINDLVHTKLDVKFDFDQAWMYGKEWLTLRPHFYATDSLKLDAKGMNIKEVALISNGKKTPLK